VKKVAADFGMVPAGIQPFNIAAHLGSALQPRDSGKIPRMGNAEISVFILKKGPAPGFDTGGALTVQEAEHTPGFIVEGGLFSSLSVSVSRHIG
jgi:hypothetical protein